MSHRHTCPTTEASPETFKTLSTAACARILQSDPARKRSSITPSSSDARKTWRRSAAPRDSAARPVETPNEMGSETARGELDQICELVMDLKFERWREGAEGKRADVDQQHRFPRIQRRGLATLADQLGIPLDIVARRFEQKWFALARDGEEDDPDTHRGRHGGRGFDSLNDFVKHRKK